MPWINYLLNENLIQLMAETLLGIYTDLPMKFPCGSDGKVSAYNAGGPGSIPGSGISPGEGNGNPLQYSCLENSMVQRSLEGYSPWDDEELDTT